ncbi:MAG: hypothetical protein ACE5MK_13750 [Acidobacteriota bacterium]
MRKVLVCLFCLLLLASVSYSSEEEILAPHKASLSVYAGDHFGEVNVTIETSPDYRKVESIRMNVGGKNVSVPKAAFNDLRNPLLNSLEIRTEAGYGKHPWLYITFDVAHREESGEWNPKKVYVAYHEGKIKHRSIKSKISDTQWHWDKKDL